MKDVLKIVAAFLLFFAVLFAAGVGFGIVNIGLTKTIGVATEDAKRQVFEHTQARVQGNIRRLSNLCTQVAAAPDKRLLNGVIAHEFADTKVKDVPAYLQSCLVTAQAVGE